MLGGSYHVGFSCGTECVRPFCSFLATDLAPFTFRYFTLTIFTSTNSLSTHLSTILTWRPKLWFVLHLFPDILNASIPTFFVGSWYCDLGVVYNRQLDCDPDCDPEIELALPFLWKLLLYFGDEAPTMWFLTWSSCLSSLKAQQDTYF